MGQQDMSEKLLEDYNDVFADIVNVLLFDGKELVKPEELADAQPYSQYKADDGKLHEQERDVAKYWRKGNMTIALCGIENQTRVDNGLYFAGEVLDLDAVTGGYNLQIAWSTGYLAGMNVG
mgnify:CR=1 FL=1